MGHIGRLALFQNSWVCGIPPIHDETVDGWGTLEGLPCSKTLGFVGSHPSTMRLWMDGAHWKSCPVPRLWGSWVPIKRQMRMVAIQRCEALRMRLFLDRARTRLPRPLIA